MDLNLPLAFQQGCWNPATQSEPANYHPWHWILTLLPVCLIFCGIFLIRFLFAKVTNPNRLNRDGHQDDDLTANEIIVQIL